MKRMDGDLRQYLSSTQFDPNPVSGNLHETTLFVVCLHLLN